MKRIVNLLFWAAISIVLFLMALTFSVSVSINSIPLSAILIILSLGCFFYVLWKAYEEPPEDDNKETENYWKNLLDCTHGNVPLAMGLNEGIHLHEKIQLYDREKKSLKNTGSFQAAQLIDLKRNLERERGLEIDGYSYDEVARKIEKDLGIFRYDPTKVQEDVSIPYPNPEDTVLRQLEAAIKRGDNRQDIAYLAEKTAKAIRGPKTNATKKRNDFMEKHKVAIELVNEMRDSGQLTEQDLKFNPFEYEKDYFIPMQDHSFMFYPTSSIPHPNYGGPESLDPEVVEKWAAEGGPQKAYDIMSKIQITCSCGCMTSENENFNNHMDFNYNRMMAGEAPISWKEQNGTD